MCMCANSCKYKFAQSFRICLIFGFNFYPALPNAVNQGNISALPRNMANMNIVESLRGKMIKKRGS